MGSQTNNEEDPEAQSIALEKRNLGEFLVTGSLYTLYTIPDEVGAKVFQFPATIQLSCVGSCQRVQTFECTRRYTGHGSSTDRGWGEYVAYRCRNCQRQEQRYFYVWKDNEFWKVGQVPELREYIDPKLKKALGDSAPLYRKAIRSRSFGFGIGAVSYLRRIVEDKTDALMDLLKDEKWEGWAEPDRAEFENAKVTFQYSQKIQYAAEKILPPTVFANGRNSFSALHDVTSNGLHGKTEEECIVIFDQCNLTFTRTFQMLSEHKREREEFAAELLALKR
ncbi:MAG TPA: hypothetical protein VGU46_06535 [Acidobacteriaceae bacterium]|nr:hypothetical protein [Acidobacteriaceae bacterium]